MGQFTDVYEPVHDAGSDCEGTVLFLVDESWDLAMTARTEERKVQGTSG